jgi:hypothetical protein
MLTDAWHVIATSDPLADSDEEDEDEHVRRDHGSYAPSCFVELLMRLQRSGSRSFRACVVKRQRPSQKASARFHCTSVTGTKTFSSDLPAKVFITLIISVQTERILNNQYIISRK